MNQNRSSHPAPRPAHDGSDRNDNIAFLAHSRRYSEADLERLASEAGKVMGISDDESGVFATNPHRCIAGVRSALCLLGRRAVRAIESGAGPGSAWAAFEDLTALARTLGTPAEGPHEQPPGRDDHRPTTPSHQKVDAPIVSIGASTGAEKLAALRDQLPAGPAATTSPRKDGKGNANLASPATA